MSFDLGTDLPVAFTQLLTSTGMDYNVIIYVGENPSFKEFHAHSVILRYRSEYFDRILAAEHTENGKYIIKKPNISPQVFEIILNYLYTGEVNIANKTGTELLEFMLLSNELMLKNLTQLADEFIIKNQHQFLQNNPVEVLTAIHNNHIPFTKLQEYCLDKICSEPNILFNSDKLIQLSSPLLEIILKRDDLNLNEIEIWENLIKWGLAQDQTLDKDISNWGQVEINIFKRILYGFIPLIKFYEISSEDYFNKVKPYEDILSKELKDDILKFYLVPRYKPVYTPRHPKCNVNSIVINWNHFKIFAKWIDRKEEDDTIIPYEFNLLYRASRDGNTAIAFHSKCDNMGATIVVVKITNSEQIVGGYTPISWDSSGCFKSTNNSFIFSFTNKNDFNTAKVVYSNSKNAIYCNPETGPVFGCSDLYLNYIINPNVWRSACARCYGACDFPHQMDVADYEVFQVINK